MDNQDLEMKNTYARLLREALLARLQDPLFVREFKRAPLQCTAALDLPPSAYDDELAVFAGTYSGQDIQHDVAMEMLQTINDHSRECKLPSVDTKADLVREPRAKIMLRPNAELRRVLKDMDKLERELDQVAKSSLRIGNRSLRR